MRRLWENYAFVQEQKLFCMTSDTPQLRSLQTAQSHIMDIVDEDSDYLGGIPPTQQSFALASCFVEQT